MKSTRLIPLATLVASLLPALLGGAACNRGAGAGAGSTCNGICAVTGVPEASSLSFGNDPVGNPTTLNLTLKNAGTAPLNVTGVSVTGPNAADFTLGATALGPQLAVTTTSTTTLTFKPSGAGTRTATVAIQTDGTPGLLNVPVTGVGVDVQICAQPGSLVFGGVQVQGTPATQTVAISNCGLSPATLNFPGIAGPQSGDFTAQGATNGTLHPHSALSVTVSYDPQAMGPSNADLPFNICSGCPNNTVSLSGVGVDGQLTFQPNPIGFPNQPAGVASTALVVGTNTGTEPLTLTQLGTYNNNAIFAISAIPTLPPLTLAPQQTFSLDPHLRQHRQRRHRPI